MDSFALSGSHSELIADDQRERKRRGETGLLIRSSDFHLIAEVGKKWNLKQRCNRDNGSLVLLVPTTGSVETKAVTDQSKGSV